MTVDLLAIVAHPDDAELLCGGTLARSAAQGHTTAILDLTAGESGSSGTPEQRAEEAANAARILGVTHRVNAHLPDGALADTAQNRVVVAEQLRRLRPRVVITHWPDSRHPDHAAAAQLARSASFLAGLKKLKADGAPHRPTRLLYSLTYQETSRRPSIVVDISEQMQTKLDAIFAFGSQFDQRESMGDVVGSGLPLRDRILAHHAHYGAMIRVAYAEPFWMREVVSVADVVKLGGSSF